MGTITDSTGIVSSSNTYEPPDTEIINVTPSRGISVNSSERRDPLTFENYNMIDDGTSDKTVISEKLETAASVSENTPSENLEYGNENMLSDNYNLNDTENTEDTEYAVSVSNSSSSVHQECSDTENTGFSDGTPEKDTLGISSSVASDSNSKGHTTIAIVGSRNTNLEAACSSEIFEASVITGMTSSENVELGTSCSPKYLELAEDDGVCSEKETLTCNSSLENQDTDDEMEKTEDTEKISETEGMKRITNERHSEDGVNIQDTLSNESLVLGTYGSTFNDAEIQSRVSNGNESPGNGENNKDSSNQAERRFQCKICNKRFHSRANLLRHEVVHTGKKGYPCSICGKEFSREYNLTTHRRIHTEEKNFKCDICGKGFYWKSCLTRHMGVHTDKDDFTCHICGKVFFNKSYVMGHMVVHTKEKVFKCDICGKGFSFKVSLRKHKVMHTNEKDFKCDICGKEFFQKSNLNLHRVVHTVVREFKCDICEKVFTSKSYLADHIALHTGEFACDICGKTFTRGKFLVQHKVKHNSPNATGRPLSKIKGTCELCGKSFSRKSHLTLHMVVHSGERNFKCDECGKTFFHKFNLVQHKAIHTGNIKCTLCGKVFGRQSRLRDHMKTHATKKTHRVGEIFSSTISGSDSRSELFGLNSLPNKCCDSVEEITIENIKTENIEFESLDDDQRNFDKDNDDSLTNCRVPSQNENTHSLNQTDSRFNLSAPIGCIGGKQNESDIHPPSSGFGIIPALPESQTVSIAGLQNENSNSQNPNYDISQLSVLRYLMALRAGAQAEITQLPLRNAVRNFVHPPDIFSYAYSYSHYQPDPNFASTNILTATQEGICSENESSRILNSVSSGRFSVSRSETEQFSGSENEYSTSPNVNYDLWTQNTVPGLNNRCVKEVEEIYIPTTVKVEREEESDGSNTEIDA